MASLIAYIRVSTSQQGKSGLGIEAQREAIQRFCEAEGFLMSGEFVEVETGKGSDALGRRPQLSAALALAKKSKQAVVVAKLDRLSRDVAFISGLMAQRVPGGGVGCRCGPVRAAPLRCTRRKGTDTDRRAHSCGACAEEGSRGEAGQPDKPC
jgi:hypothetical protein